MVLSPAEFAEARQAIEALNAEFAWLIDNCDGAGVESLFTTDGVYDMSNRVFRSRDQIKGFYDARKARGLREQKPAATCTKSARSRRREIQGSPRWLVICMGSFCDEPREPFGPQRAYA